MSLVNKNSIFGAKPAEEENGINGALVDRRSFLTPLKVLKYDPLSTRFIGGSRTPALVTPPAPEPPPPPILGAFSNAFSNAFNI